MKNVNIMRVHKKYGEFPKKEGLGKFAGGLVKNRERVFL